MRKIKQSRRLIALALSVIMVWEMFPISTYAQNSRVISDSTQQEADAGQCSFESHGCSITYIQNQAWNNYVSAEVVIHNHTQYDKSLWSLQMDYDGVIDNVWNADIKELTGENNVSGYRYQVDCKPYNTTIPAGGSVTFGFLAYGETGVPSMPSEIFYDTTVTGADKEESTEEETTEAGAIDGREYEIPGEWKGLNYTLFTGSKGQQSLYVNEAMMKGSVHANGDFFFQGTRLGLEGTLESAGSITLRTADGKDTQTVCSRVEDAEEIDMPDLIPELDKALEDTARCYEGNQVFNSDAVTLNEPVKVNGSAMFQSTSFEGHGVICAGEDVTFQCGSVVTDKDAGMFVVSRQGDITVNGSTVTMNSVLYAPNGTVNINTGEFHLKGRIIARSVNINGTLIRLMQTTMIMMYCMSLGLFRKRRRKKQQQRNQQRKSRQRKSPQRKSRQQKSQQRKSPQRKSQRQKSRQQKHRQQKSQQRKSQQQKHQVNWPG